MFRTRLVALLATNPAFVELSGRTLEDHGGYNVATFSSIGALTTFLRISPVDVVVLDSELPGGSVVATIRALRLHPKLASPVFSIIALTRADAVPPQALLEAGADSVLQKPVAPGQLLAEVQKFYPQRRSQVVHYRRPIQPSIARKAQPHRTGNVIPLFGEGRTPR
ncbi:MAG TPA: response regulator [Devosiaceae bacterium]|jgi:DNA-binding response OmpR family regulator